MTPNEARRFWTRVVALVATTTVATSAIVAAAFAPLA